MMSQTTVGESESSSKRKSNRDWLAQVQLPTHSILAQSCMTCTGNPSVDIFPIAAITPYDNSNTGGQVSPEAFDINLQVCHDATHWWACVTAVGGAYSVQTRPLPGPTGSETTPPILIAQQYIKDGGSGDNVTQADFCAQALAIMTLGRPTSFDPSTANGVPWVLEAALVAHEAVHVGHLESTLVTAVPWGDIAAFEAVPIPYVTGQSVSTAIYNFKHSQPYYDLIERLADWWGVFSGAETWYEHNVSDEPDYDACMASQSARTSICSRANSSGWTPPACAYCPPTPFNC